MKTMLMRAITDERGNVSHARIIALLVGFSATVFMWKLLITGGLNTEYFTLYLLYGVVHMNLSKSLDVLNNFLGRRNEGPRPAPRGDATTSEGDGRGRLGRPADEDLRDVGDGAGVKTPNLGAE